MLLCLNLLPCVTVQNEMIPGQNLTTYRKARSPRKRRERAVCSSWRGANELPQLSHHAVAPAPAAAAAPSGWSRSFFGTSSKPRVRLRKVSAHTYLQSKQAMHCTRSEWGPLLAHATLLTADGGAGADNVCQRVGATTGTAPLPHTHRRPCLPHGAVLKLAKPGEVEPEVVGGGQDLEVWRHGEVVRVVEARCAPRLDVRHAVRVADLDGAGEPAGSSGGVEWGEGGGEDEWE